MKDNFRGWTSVYAFTFRQSTKGLGFKLVTTLVTLIILAAFIVINVVVAKPDKENLETSPVKKVFILDNSGLNPADYKAMLPKEFQHIEFEAVNGKSSDVVKIAGANSYETLAAIISVKEDGYELKAIIPENSKLKEKHAKTLINSMASAFETSKLMQAGLSADQLTKVLKPAVVSFANVGENTSEIAKVIKVVAPMVFSLVLYFMLLLYGQTVSKSVSTEKTSKLMETLLTSVHPYALIAGKVLAVTSMGLLQFVSWIIAAVVGLYGGNAVAHAFYPQYENSAITIINFLKDNIGETAMTVPAVVLAVIFFCVGFLFYSVLAALAGSMVSKPEDVASTQALFQFPIIISWLVTYFAPMLGKQGLVKASRYIPFTAPFTVPADLITGSIGLLEGVITLTLMLIFSLLAIILSARIYKGLVLYNGQKLSFKVIGNILKADK